jgi:hypothetical protein
MGFYKTELKKMILIRNTRKYMIMLTLDLLSVVITWRVSLKEMGRFNKLKGL